MYKYVKKRTSFWHLHREDWELEEEWEGDDDTEVTGESLGVAIVRHAHNAFSGDLIDFSEISPATEYAREPSGQVSCFWLFLFYWNL